MAGFDFGKLFNGQMTEANTADRLAGIGTSLAALDQGKVADLSDFRQGIRGRIASDELREQMSDPALLSQFTPEQRQMLATLPPQAAQKIIAETVFKAPDPATAFRQKLQESGVLSRYTPEQQAVLMTLDPTTAQKLIADTVFAGTPDPVKGVVVDRKLVNPLTGDVVYEGTPEPGYRTLSEEEVAEKRLPSGFYQEAPNGRITSIDGQTINVNTGNGTDVLDLDNRTGRALVADPEAENGLRWVDIPGGSSDKESDEARKKDLLTQGAALASADNTLDLIEESRLMIQGNPSRTTGWYGNLARNLGGSEANDLEQQLISVRAATAFDKLQAMRDASPTGGALGGVSGPELKFLESAIASLDQSQSSEQLLKNLQRVQNAYEDARNLAIYGPEWRQIIADGMSDDDLLEMYTGGE